MNNLNNIENMFKNLTELPSWQPPTVEVNTQLLAMNEMVAKINRSRIESEQAKERRLHDTIWDSAQETIQVTTHQLQKVAEAIQSSTEAMRDVEQAIQQSTEELKKAQNTPPFWRWVAITVFGGIIAGVVSTLLTQSLLHRP